MVLAIRLKSAGYAVSTATDARSGLDAAIKEQPDAVLLDVSMPGGDGFSVAEGIQKLGPKLPPIIFLTASKRPEFRKRANELGAAGFFEKPFDASELLAAVQATLSN